MVQQLQQTDKMSRSMLQLQKWGHGISYLGRVTSQVISSYYFRKATLQTLSNSWTFPGISHRLNNIYSDGQKLTKKLSTKSSNNFFS